MTGTLAFVFIIVAVVCIVAGMTAVARTRRATRDDAAYGEDDEATYAEEAAAVAAAEAALAARDEREDETEEPLL